MGRVQYDRRRSLVDLPGLDADEPVLHHVNPPHTVGAGDRFETPDQLDQRHRDTVDRGRDALLEVQLDMGRRVGRVGRRFGQRVDLLRRLRPRILEHTTLDRSPPEIRVGAVRAIDRGGHGDTALPRVGNLGGT